MQMTEISASGGDTSTQFPASPTTGTVYGWVKTDNTFNTVSLLPNTGQTIEGSPSPFLLCTPLESASFFWDGITWRVVGRFNDWSQGPIPVPILYDLGISDLSGNGPSKGDTSAPTGTDELYWTRVGGFLRGIVNYRQNSGGADTHALPYWVPLPSGLFIANFSSTAFDEATSCYGAGTVYSVDWSVDVLVRAYFSKGISLVAGLGNNGSLIPGGGSGFCIWGSGANPNQAGAMAIMGRFAFECMIPISGWH